MKKLNMFTLFALLVLACSKNNTTTQSVILTPKNGSCYDTVPSNTVCAAYWERWFYDESIQKCVKKGYSGCDKLGCETEAECIACATGNNKSLLSGQVLRFNYEKCGCCWGFVVKVNNVEYVINDPKIFNVIDYLNITQPIDVELEFGQKDTSCAEIVVNGLKPATIKEFKLK